MTFSFAVCIMHMIDLKKNMFYIPLRSTVVLSRGGCKFGTALKAPAVALIDIPGDFVGLI